MILAKFNLLNNKNQTIDSFYTEELKDYEENKCIFIFIPDNLENDYYTNYLIRFRKEIIKRFGKRKGNIQLNILDTKTQKYINISFIIDSETGNIVY